MSSYVDHLVLSSAPVSTADHHRPKDHSARATSDQASRSVSYAAHVDRVFEFIVGHGNTYKISLHTLPIALTLLEMSIV